MTNGNGNGNGSKSTTIVPSAPVQHGRGTIQPTAQISTALANATNQGELAALAMAAKQKALTEARFTLAQHRPRDLDVVRERLLKECRRPSFAKSALYLKPVGDGIEGLSIRFVEAALSALGNVYSDVVTIHDDPDRRILHVEVTDAESNVSYSTEVTVHKTVERNSVREGDEVVRTRTNSKGRTVYVKRATDDEVLNTLNALVSKAVRTNGLRLLPGWIRDECLDLIKATVDNEQAADPDAAKRKLFDAFAMLGVSADKLKAWLGHDGQALQPAERTALVGIYNALRDGETTWPEVEDQREATRAKGAKPVEQPKAEAKGAAGLKARMAQAKAVIAPEQTEQKSEPEPTPPGGGDEWGLEKEAAAADREPGEEG